MSGSEHTVQKKLKQIRWGLGMEISAWQIICVV